MSAHVRPDDTPLSLPGLGPSPIHEALAALSRAADAACSRAAMGCTVADIQESLVEVVDLVLKAARLVDGPVDKSGGP